MQILLANAKIMREAKQLAPVARECAMTRPRFQTVADRLADEMARHDAQDLARQLDCSMAIARENKVRYACFHKAEKIPALYAYNGQAYKHLKADTLPKEAVNFAQNRLWITCFLYGLLRPLDAIVPYRMEHTVVLEETGDKPIHTYWKDLLTDVLIESVKADDGLLLHLSTEEYEHLFDWKRVCREVRVVQPLFYVETNGRLKMQAVWAKSCRGAMVRYVLENRIADVYALKGFEYEGFVFAPEGSSEEKLLFVRG